MNAKIKLSVLTLAGVAMLASCGAKGQSLTRAEAETELDTYASKAPAATKVTYTDAWEGETAKLILDTTEVFGYHKFTKAVETKTDNVTVTTYHAGAEYFAYKNGENYLVGYQDGETKTYATADETTVKSILTAALSGVVSYAGYQAQGTSNWLKGFDKTEKWIADNNKDKTSQATYDELGSNSSVKGYISAESYTKYAEGEFTADITAQYPFQQDMIDMGGENCIYEWKNYQLTRLYNNYQKYEEKLNWEAADTANKGIDMATWTPANAADKLFIAKVTAAIAYLGHAWSD